MRYARAGGFWHGHRRPRAILAIGAAVLVLISAGLMRWIVSGGARLPIDPLMPSASSSTDPILLPRRIDGVLVPRGQERLPVTAVVVENHPDARPLSGVSRAAVVIEAPVEGGITRLLLIMNASSTVERIGPIRSARPYFVEWARGWNAAFVHVGGSPDALSMIRQLGGTLTNVDEMAGARAIWRDRERPAPHNAYTSAERLRTSLDGEDGGERLAPPLAWHFQDLTTSTHATTTSSLSVPSYTGSYSVRWVYDADRGVYTRYQAGRLQRDDDGSMVEAENIIVVMTGGRVLDSVGRLLLDTVGTGDAFLTRGGMTIPIRWSRVAGEPIRFMHVDATDVLLTRGRTWIHVIQKELKR